MKLSVIIPVYNGEKYIRDCLNSIINEIDNNVEVIIIDDGSTDGSREIYKSYEKFNNIKILLNSNHGVSYSRNLGISKSKGKFLMFVDIDDFMVKGWYNLLTPYLDSNNDIIYVGNNYSDLPIDKDLLINYIYKINNKNYYLSGPWSKLFRRSFIINNNISFDSNIINGEDMIFNTEALVTSNNIDFINKSIYSFRINNNSSTHRFNKKYFSSDKKFLIKISKLLKDNSNKKNIYDRCVNNSIMIMINKLSMISYNEAKNYLSVFDSEPYISYINNNNYALSKKDKIIFYLIKNKKYKLLLFILNKYNKLKKFIKRDKETIIEI